MSRIFLVPLVISYPQLMGGCMKMMLQAVTVVILAIDMQSDMSDACVYTGDVLWLGWNRGLRVWRQW